MGTAPTPSSAPALVASPAIVHRLTSRPTRFSLTLAGPRAFSPNGDGRSDALAVALALPADGRAVVLARSFDGADVATLLDQDEPAGVVELTWDGSGVPDAPYTIVAQFGGQQATVGVARWSTEPLLSAPGSIVVVFDPGHGGNQEGGGSGNLPDGRRISEKTVNLDIARRAGAMLSAAGLVVRYTRTSDATVSLTDRIRFANAVRGDVFVAVHNNFIPGGGGRTEAFYCGTGCRAPSVSFSLARQILAAHLERLSPFESPAWQPTPSPLSGWNPTDDWDLWGGEGVAAGPSRHLYVLGPYDHLFRPDALVMASALSESLAATLPTELEMLGDPAVRGALGAAYADGIARFLAGRPVGVRLTAEGSVGTTRVGRTKMLRIRVTNTGSTPIPAGSVVSVGDRSRLAAVDGSLQTGRRIGSRRLATPLAPGSSTVIATPVRPRVAGARTWVVDLIVGNVGLSARRIPTLRLGPSVRP